MSGSWPIDHVAIVVGDLDAAIDLYTRVLGFEQVYREIISDQGVEAAGVRAGDSTIELLRTLDENSPIARYRGDAPAKVHHVAYRVNDIEAALAELKGKGIRLIDEHPRRGAHGTRIAFLHPKSTGGVLTELCEPCEDTPQLTTLLNAAVPPNPR
jgi:methylmalonyl-CoA epimerase